MFETIPKLRVVETWRSLAAVSSGERRFGERVLIQIKPDQCARSFTVERQLVGFQRKDREDITMRFVARRRTRAAKTRLAEIGAALRAACGR